MYYVIAFVAGLVGLLFGYDASIISSAILFIKPDLSLRPDQVGAIVSAVPFGAFAASLLCGRFDDWWGRKRLLLFTAALFFVGSIVSAMADTRTVLIIGRAILGVSIGFGSFTAPLYIAEMSKETARGGLVTLNQLSITIGILVAYFVGYLLAPDEHWRYMLLGGAVLAVPLFVAMLFLPESPRWLYASGNINKAKAVLNKVYQQQLADKIFYDLKNAVFDDKPAIKEFFDNNVIRVLLLGIVVSILTQAIGINAIIYYAPTVFHGVIDSTKTAAVYASVSIGVINVLFTVIAIFLLDRVGRRKLLMIGLSGIIISLSILTVSFYLGLTHRHDFIFLVLGCFLLFVACQAFSTGPICWLIPSEIFPTRIRGVGIGLAVSFNWLANVVVAFFFPIALSKLGSAWTFAGFLVIAVLTIVIFYRFVPELKGVALERVEENLYSGKKLRDLGQ